MKVDSPQLATLAAEAAPARPAPSAAHARATAPQPIDVQAAVENVNRYLASVNRNLQFELDRQTGKLVVRVVDVATREVVRQIPSEEMLQIARALSQSKGLLLRDAA